MDEKLIKVVDELKAKGYFKSGNRGEVKRWSKRFSGFETRNPFQFKEDLKELGISEKQAMEIKKNLPPFPNRKYNNYQNYLKCCEVPSFNKVVTNFENKFYRENSLKKNDKEIVLTVGSSISNITQVLINNDIFTDGKKLYKYDREEKSFLRIGESNISEIIGIDNALTCKKIYNLAIANRTYLINIYNSVNEFQHSKYNDMRKEKYKADYEYISDLKESIKKEYCNSAA